MMLTDNQSILKKHNQSKQSLEADIGNIDSWTFGILTIGKRETILKQMIDSIRKQKIPKVEIIICGRTKIKSKDIINIDFPDEKHPKGWITRKKNIIVDRAKYENICMLHDRIVFDRNWYREMKKYGNTFEVLGCRVTRINKKNERAGDWLTVGSDDWMDFKMGYLDYRDEDKYGFIGSGLTMVKKTIVKKIRWNENLFRTDNEDIDFHQRLLKAGCKIQVNPKAQAYAYFWRFGQIPYYSYSPGKSRRMQGMYLRRFLAFLYRLIYHSPAKNLALKFYETWHLRMRGGWVWKLMNS